MGNIPQHFGNVVPSIDMSRPQRLLIVDDEVRIRSAYRTLLSQENRVIVECGTGAEAMRCIEREGADVVILDLGLPDMAGLDVMEWIRASGVAASVIVFSADESIDSAIQALRLGAYEFIRKSCEPEELMKTVDNAFHRRYLEESHALMTATLERSERLHRFLVEQSPDIIYTLDEEGRFVFINGRVESLLGYARNELIGQHYSAIVYEDDLDRACYAFNERRSDDRAASNVEIRLKYKGQAGFRHFDNRLIVAMFSALGIYERNDADQVQRFMGTYGVARDITERKQAEETISFQAFHDQLTQLPNRALFKDRLDLAIAQSRRSGKKVGVMFADLDRFKLVNDTYGHAEGDELLRGFAQRVKGCLRAGDTLARQGGDEFTLALTDLGSADDAIRIIEKILASLETPFLVAGKDFKATASFGFALFPDDGDTAESLVHHADIAMYQVKLRGKNGYQRYFPEMSEGHDHHIRFENDLRVALTSAQFQLHYQPQVNLSSGAIIGVEALLRWRHPEHGLLNPNSFIAIAEESGLICAISDWVMAESFAQLAEWNRQGIRDIRMSVNLSPQEFERDDLVARVIAPLQRFDLDPANVEIEITENLLMGDAEGVIDKVRQIRAHGMRVSIDDFGTRYSSLNYLRRFSISGIKIDQSFVRDLDKDHGSLSIIHAVLGIAKGFGLHVIAEGIEHAQQVGMLQLLGCDEMQGFLFSKPLPAEELLPLLRDGLPGVGTLFGDGPVSGAKA
ncbi:MAG: EAL domain-containing protein [Rhodocyclaceae bacterium]|nr:MAG: EAL domain-containing protein [Rhodocyclaceae bacterium]